MMKKKRTGFSKFIEEDEQKLIELLGEDNTKLIAGFKISIINHMQELEIENMREAMNFGVLIGMEIQEIINEYINENH